MDKDKKLPAAAAAPQVHLSSYPMLTKKAFLLPDDGEEKAFQAKKNEYLLGIYEIKIEVYFGTHFDTAEKCQFQLQFGKLIAEYKKFAATHFNELVATHKGLGKDYCFAQCDVDTLDSLKGKVARGTFFGIDKEDDTSSKEEKIRHRNEFFQKIKNKLEEILFSMVTRLAEQKDPNARQATLRQIADTYVHFAYGFAENICTAGALGAAEGQHNKWCGKNDIAGTLLSARKSIVERLAEEYVERVRAAGKPVHDGSQTHISQNYRFVFYTGGAGITPEVEDKYVGSGSDAKQLVLKTAGEELKAVFPREYNYETVCETVAQAEYKKYKAIVDKYAAPDKDFNPLKSEFKKEMQLLLQHHICTEADLITSEEVDGVEVFKINPTLLGKLLDYCRRYSPKILQQEGFVTDIDQCPYSVIEKGQTVKAPLSQILAKMEGSETIDVLLLNKGYHFLTHALRKGEFYKFMALLHKVKAAGPVGVRPDTVQDTAPDTTSTQLYFNPKVADRSGLTPVAVLIINRPLGSADSKERYLTPWQQTLALRLLLDHPAITSDDLTQTVGKNKLLLRDIVAHDNCPIEVFSLFWQGLYEKARYSYQLELGRAAKQAAVQDDDPDLAGGEAERKGKPDASKETSIEEIARLGAKELKQSDPEQVEGYVGKMLTDYANQKIPLDQGRLVPPGIIALAVAGDFRKIHRLLSVVPNLDLDGIKTLAAFNEINTPLGLDVITQFPRFKNLKPADADKRQAAVKHIEKLRNLLYLPRRIKGEARLFRFAKEMFLKLVHDEDAKRPAGAPPARNLQTYQDLLALVCKQCGVDQVKAFIAEMAKDEYEVAFRLALAARAPDVVDLSSPMRLVLPNNRVELGETVLRIVIKQKDAKQIEQLLEWDVDPSVEVKGESALTLAATPGVLDVPQQQRIIPLLLESNKFSSAQRAGWLMQMAASRYTYTAFAAVWKHAKDEIKLRSGPAFEKQIGFLRYVYLEREKQEVVAKWAEYKVGEVDPALRLQIVAELINAFEPKPEDVLQQEGCQSCQLSGLQALVAFIVEMKKRRAQEMPKFIRAQLRTPASVFGVAELSAAQLLQHVPRAKQLLGGDGSADRDKFIEQSYPSLANQLDAQGYNVLYYLARDGQHDKLDTLLVEVVGLDFSKVWQLPDIKLTRKLARGEKDKLIIMRHLLQLIYNLQSTSFDYAQAKALFLALSPADSNCYPYATLVQIIVNQCPEQHQLFLTKLTEEAETDADCLLAIHRKMGNVDLTRTLVKATAPTCNLVTFKNIVEQLKQANQLEQINQLPWGDAVPPHTVVVPSDAKLEAKQPQRGLIAVLTPLQVREPADFKLQFAKFKCLLSTMPVMRDLQACYPVSDRRFRKSPQDVFMDLLLAVGQQRWPIAIANYLIYLDKIKAYDPAANGDVTLKELLGIISMQFNESAATAFSSQLDAEKTTPNQFSQVVAAIQQGEHQKARRLLLPEEKAVDAITTTNRLSDDLSLMMNLYWIANNNKGQQGFEEKIEAFCNDLLASFIQQQELQLIIILHAFEAGPKLAARLFLNHFIWCDGILLAEKHMLANIEKIQIHIKELAMTDIFIKTFFKTIFERLFATKKFCQYKYYPQLLWQAFQWYGYADAVFSYKEGQTTITENPLCYFLRTHQYAAATKLLAEAKDKDVGVNKPNSHGIFALMHVADIKEGDNRQEWLGHLLALKPGKEALNGKDAKGNTALIRFTMMGDSKAVAMLLQYASQHYAKDFIQFEAFAKHKNMESKSAFGIARETKPQGEKQDAILLSLLEYMCVNEEEWQLCQSPKGTTHQFSAYNVTQLLSLLQGQYFENDDYLTRDLDACFPQNYDMQNVGEQMVRLLKIIDNYIPVKKYIPLISLLWERYLTLPVQPNVAVLTTLIRMAPNVQLVDGHGQLQPLFPYTVLTDNQELFNLLLECKIDVNQKNAQNETALLLTCNSPNLDEKAQLSRVTRLLEQKADARIKPKTEKIASDVALKSNCHFQTFLRLYEYDEEAFEWASKAASIFKTEIEALQPPRGKAADAEQKRKIMLTQNKQLFSQLHEALASPDAKLRDVGVAVQRFLSLMTVFDSDTLLRILQVIRTITKKRFPGNLVRLLEHLLSKHAELLLQKRYQPLLFNLFQNHGQDLSNGDSILHWLIRQKSKPAYDYAGSLLEQKQVNIKHTNKEGLRPFMLLVQQQGLNPALCQAWLPLLMTHDPVLIEGDVLTELMYAVRVQSPELFAVVVAEVQKQPVSADGVHPLISADGVHPLNHRSPACGTALWFAATSEHVSLPKVRTLLAIKAVDKTLEDKKGCSPLEAASPSYAHEPDKQMVAAFFEFDQDDTFKHYLITKYKRQQQAGRPIDSTLQRLVTEACYRLFLAAEAQGDATTMATMLETGIKDREGQYLNVGDSKGITALMWAADIKDEKMREHWVNYLVQPERGMRHDLLDANDDTAFMRAIKRKYTSTALLLLDHAVRVSSFSQFSWLSASNKQGETPLELAVATQQQTVAWRLLECMRLAPTHWLSALSRLGVGDKTLHQWSLYNVLNLVSTMHAAFDARQDEVIHRTFDLCFPADYKLETVNDQVLRLLPIMQQQLSEDRRANAIQVLLKRYLALPLQPHLEVVKKLIQMAPPTMQLSVALPGDSQRTHSLLGYSVFTKNKDLFDLLLEMKTNVNQTNSRRETALYVALDCSVDAELQQYMVTRLLEHKADQRDIHEVAMRDKCHFSTFLTLIELDEKNSFEPMSRLLRSTVRSIEASQLAQNKLDFLLLVFQRLPEKSFGALLTHLDNDTLLRVVNIVKKKLPPSRFNAFLEDCLRENAQLLLAPEKRVVLLSFFKKHDIHLQSRTGDSMLHWLIKQKTKHAYDYAKQLIDSKQIESVEANLPNQRGYTPLMLLLLDEGEDSASYLALVSALIPLCRPLQATSTDNGKTTLMYAARYLENPALFPAFTQVLAETKAADALNRQDSVGHTALRHAVEAGVLWKVQQLLEVKEVNRLLEDKYEVSPIEAARQSNKNTIVAAFFTQDADDKTKQYLIDKYHRQRAASARLSPALVQVQLATEAFYRLYCQAVTQDKQAEVMAQQLERYNQQRHYSVWCMDLLEFNLPAALTAGYLPLLKVLLMGAGSVVGISSSPGAIHMPLHMFKIHNWLQRFDTVLLPETIQALYADPQLKPLWPSAALVFAKDFARQISAARAGELTQLRTLLPVVEQMIANAMHWPRPLKSEGEVNVMEILDYLEQGRRKILSSVLPGAVAAPVVPAPLVPAPYTAAFKEAVVAGRGDVVYWLLTHGAEQPYLIDVNEPEEKGRDPIIFRVLQQARDNQGDPKWLRIVEAIINHPTWQSDLLNQQGSTVLMQTATYPQLFSKVLAATPLKTQLLEDKERKSAMDYVVQSLDAKKEGDRDRVNTEITQLQTQLPAELKIHTQRIEWAQQGIFLEDMKDKLSALKATEVEKKAQLEQASGAVETVSPQHPEYKSKQKTHQRITNECRVIAEEIKRCEQSIAQAAPVDAPAPDYSQAQRLAIERMKYYLYQAGRQLPVMLGAGATRLPFESTQALLRVMQDPTETNFAQLRSLYKVDVGGIASIPEYMALYKLFFRCQIALAPINCHHFMVQDLLLDKSNDAAVRKFMVLYDTHSAAMPDAWFVASLASIQPLVSAGQFLEFCELLLTKLAIRALANGHFGFVKELMAAHAGTTEVDGEAQPGVGLLARRPLPDTTQLCSALLAAPKPLNWERVVALKNDDEKILTPAWPFAALAFAKAFARNEQRNVASLASATAALESILTIDENIEEYAQGILLRTLAELYAGIIPYTQTKPLSLSFDIKPLQNKMAAVFKQLITKRDDARIGWLLKNNRLGVNEELKEIKKGSAPVRSQGTAPAAFFPADIKASVRRSSSVPPVLLVDPWIEISPGKSFIFYCLDLVQGHNRACYIQYLQLIADDVWGHSTPERARQIFMRVVQCDSEVFSLLITRTPIENLVMRNPTTQKTWMDWMLTEGNYGPHIERHAQCLADTLLVALRAALSAVEALTLARQIAGELLKFHAFVLKPLSEKAERRFASSIMGAAPEQLKYKAVEALQSAFSKPTAENIAALAKHQGRVAQLTDFNDLFNAVHHCIMKLPTVTTSATSAITIDMDMF